MQKILHLRLVLLLLLLAAAAIPDSGVAADRLYTADEVSNTLSVIDHSTDKLLGLLKLGMRS